MTPHAPVEDGVAEAARHALAWLLIAGAAGAWLSLLLLAPGLQAGAWTYGRWVPVHLNGQLYGWSALPLVAWLLRIYQSDGRWGVAAVWAWSAALALGCWSWLQGGSSGKIFLDWSGGALAALAAAMVVLWLALADGWRRTRGRWRLVGLLGLATVPPALVAAASPGVYPPIDATTGGPTGASLLGSTLGVVGLMLLLPATLARRRAPGGRGTLVFFGASWLVFAVAERLGGTHRDPVQLLAMALLLPWVVLLPRCWRRYEWPAAARGWRRAMLGWWALLVTSGVAAYLPRVLDRLKFTQGLVAHSHLAMAGFTTSFCACLLTLLGTPVGGRRSQFAWHAAALGMVATLAALGWAEGADPGWMTSSPAWRTAGMIARTACGMVMLAAAAAWWRAALRPPAPAWLPDPEVAR